MTPSSVHIHWKVGKEFWDCETPEVKEDIAQVAWERHDQQMKEWKENQQPLETPEDFHH